LIGAPVTLHTDSAAPPRVAVELGKHDAGERQRLSKRLRGVDRVLTLHRVDHEQRLDGFRRRVQLRDLAHHRVVDGEAPGGVDDDDIHVVLARPVERGCRDVERLLTCVGGEELGADLRGERLQLRDRRRPVDVAAHQEHLFFLLVAKDASELGGAGRLPGALQAREQDHRRWRGRKVERRSGASHERREPRAARRRSTPGPA
jgi:hypothetical protein